MAILREEVQKLVEVFYQPPFKTFYVNSINGESFVKPTGVFISLGITTSTKMLEDLKDILSEKYNASLAEISSIKKGNQYLNTLTNTHNPEKYLCSDEPGVLNEEKAREELSRLRESMSQSTDLVGLQENATKITKLQELIDKLSDNNSKETWETHRIQKDENMYHLFHRYVNYKRIGEVEYRIGIYISEKVKD